LLEALLCIVRYAIKTLDKFLQANGHLSAGRHFAIALTNRNGISMLVFLYSKSHAIQSQMAVFALSPGVTLNVWYPYAYARFINAMNLPA